MKSIISRSIKKLRYAAVLLCIFYRNEKGIRIAFVYTKKETENTPRLDFEILSLIIFTHIFDLPSKPPSSNLFAFNLVDAVQTKFAIEIYLKHIA